jgi:hypothetical protein
LTRLDHRSSSQRQLNGESKGDLKEKWGSKGWVLLQIIPINGNPLEVLRFAGKDFKTAWVPLAWGHFIALTARPSLKKRLRDPEMSNAATQKGLLSLR